MLLNNDFITNNSDIAEAFNNFVFVNVVVDITKIINSSAYDHTQYIRGYNFRNFSFTRLN